MGVKRYARFGSRAFLGFENAHACTAAISALPTSTPHSPLPTLSPATPTRSPLGITCLRLLHFSQRMGPHRVQEPSRRATARQNEGWNVRQEERRIYYARIYIRRRRSRCISRSMLLKNLRSANRVRTTTPWYERHCRERAYAGPSPR